jgi:hypothetical protein
MSLGASTALAQGPVPPGGIDPPPPPLPVIFEFTGTNFFADLWAFSGTAGGGSGPLTITFDGIVSGSTTAGPDGEFEWTTEIPAGTTGTVTAVATDPNGVQSETVWYFVMEGGG